jgi:linoleoyl-CoA desaturase
MRESELNEAARRLREELRVAGYFERPPAPVLVRWCAHLLLAFGGLYVFVESGPILLRIAALLVSCFGFLGQAMIAHTASHNGVSDNRFVNQLITFVSYPLLLMLSATYWHRSHVQIHHPSPNVVDVDDDCDLRPLFALNDEHVRDGSLPPGIRRVVSALLPLLLPLNGFGMHRHGWSHLVDELRKEPRARQQHVWLDVVCMSLHLVLWLGLPMFWFSPAQVIGTYALRVGIMGFGLFSILAPGHFPAEAQCLHVSLRAKNFYVRQTMTALNFRTSWLGHFLCSGLEYQIEHHLFPTISHVHLPAVSRHVRAFCEANGLPYRTLGWGEAIWKSYLVFLRPKPVLRDLRIEHAEPAPRSWPELGAGLTASPSSIPPA